MGRVLILLCLLNFFLSSLADGPTGKKCPSARGRGETCVCKTKDGVIDLTPLSNTDGTPRFAGIQSGGKYSYAYNPCSTYQDSNNKGNCDDVHMCQSGPGDEAMIGGAPGDEEMWIDTDGSPYAYYEPSSLIKASSKQQATGQNNTLFDDNIRVGMVKLICDYTVSVGDSEIIFAGEEPVLHYHFNLTSCQACPGGCTPHKPEPKTSPAGPVGLAIILACIVGLVAYFVAGLLIMKFYKKASGTDIIPNKGFWITSTSLVKDGFVFTFGPCVRLVRDKVRGRQGYSMQ